MGSTYETDDLGDIVAVIDDAGGRMPLDPAEWSWATPGGSNDPEDRLPLEELEALPGFTVHIEDGRRLDPGPVARLGFDNFRNGAAPPCVLDSRGGDGGTRANMNRLSQTVALVARQLAARPERSPMVIHDLVGGRRIEVTCEPPRAGAGRVYVLTDGFAYKIGWTGGTVADRILCLQTGNPRVIVAVAAIENATGQVERDLHVLLDAHRLRKTGEWFDLDGIHSASEDVGGLVPWLCSLTGRPEGDIVVHRQL